VGFREPHALHPLAAITIVALAIVSLALTASSALAAADPTMLSVSCNPASAATGTAVPCTALVTDTAPSPSAPTGEVDFSSTPNGGGFAASTPCALAPQAADSASCAGTFTATRGAVYTVTASYEGDSDHITSTGSTSLQILDATTTSVVCSPASVLVDSSTDCTATLTDATAPQPPSGSVTFTSSPATATFGAPSTCSWQLSGSGGSGTCDVTFTPAAAGPFTITASYSGDDGHAASSGTASVLAAAPTTVSSTPVPSALEPALPEGFGNSPTPITGLVGVLRIARRGLVSGRRLAGIALSCSGAAGATCSGTLTLTGRETLKVKRRVKGHKRTVKQTRTINLGSVGYSLTAGHGATAEVRLSKAAKKLLARVHSLRAHASATRTGATTVQATVTLARAKTKGKHKKRKKKK